MSTKTSTSSKIFWLLIAVIILGAIAFFMMRETKTFDLPIETTQGPTNPGEDLALQTASVPGLEIGMTSAEVENLLEERFAPETSEGNQSFQMRLTPQTENGYSLIAVADNILDDSLKAQEITAFFRPDERNNFVLSDYNMRVQCRRGSNIGNWQTQVCP
jgi:hypothetical protein